jgi:hypothetical protein
MSEDVPQPLFLRRKSAQLSLASLPAFSPLGEATLSESPMTDVQSMPTPGITPMYDLAHGPTFSPSHSVPQMAQTVKAPFTAVPEFAEEIQTFKTWPRTGRLDAMNSASLHARSEALSKELEMVQARAVVLKTSLEQHAVLMQQEALHHQHERDKVDLIRQLGSLQSSDHPMTMPIPVILEENAQPALTMYPVHELARLATYMVFHLWYKYPLVDLQLPIVTKFNSEVIGNLKRARSNTDDVQLTSPLIIESTSVADPSVQIDMIQFLQYVTHMLHTTRLPSAMVAISLLYIHRLQQLNPTLVGHRGSEFRAWTTACMLSNKVLDDNRFTNKTWSVVSGIPLRELNVMELEFMKGLEWNLEVRPKVWNGWVLHVESSGLWTKVKRELHGMRLAFDSTKKLGGVSLLQVFSCMARGITAEENEKGLWWHRTVPKNVDKPLSNPVNNPERKRPMLSLKGHIPPIPNLLERPSGDTPGSAGSQHSLHGISYQYPAVTPRRTPPTRLTPGVSANVMDYFALPVREKTMVPTSSHGDEVSALASSVPMIRRLAPPLPTPPWEYPAPPLELLNTEVSSDES